MNYNNPLAQKLALAPDDLRQEAKLYRLCADLATKVHIPVEGAIDWHYLESNLAPEEALAADWRQWARFEQRTVWARHQDHTWFAAEIVVPEAAKGQTLIARISSQWQQRPGTTDPQCLAWLDGKIAQAIDGNHTEIVIARDAVPGATHTLLVNAFTFFERPLVGFGAELLLRNERVERLLFDILTPLEVATRLHQSDGRRHAIMRLVDTALRALDRRGTLEASDEALSAAEAIAGEIYALTDTEAKPTITAVGHTHIDVGWLWRVLHTRDKTGRSFATVLNLMAEFPDYVFMYNQAVLFHFLKTDYPEIWEGVKEKVKSGQFEIEGAMWVEPDCNIVSGESLVRQIMHGRRFHRDEFGVTPKCVWLPDTFGYSANLPQIMERSGLDYFITSKLSWNDSDRHPYDTFFWRGIDGTETKAQLITAQKLDSEAIFTTYNSDLSVSEVMGAWKRYEPKAVSDELVLCYGYGDGGGGPTREMIQRGERLARGIPGAPRVKLEGLGPFLDRLGARMEDGRDAFPRWNGELYLQYHRGTLTTIARNKANNRRAEREMRELEFVAALAAQRGQSYPRETIDEFWRTVLINQFHDILPGTSIPEVYTDSDAEYGELFAALGSANGPVVQAITALVGDGSEPVAINFTSQDRSGELVAMEAREGTQEVIRADGSREALGRIGALPPLGWQRLALEGSEDGVSADRLRLENGQLRVEFDEAGEIVSIFDKARGREVLAKGQRGNRLIAYEDKPMNWDAWDIDWYFEEQAWPLAEGECSVELVETGPLRAALKVTRRYGQSRFVQVISLASGSRQIEFDTFIDWRERQTVVKASFPFDLNTSEIRSEIQFGHVTRATHRNTSWDRARFEASMHRWVDMSEADFGVALLNDCKYGYDAHEQTVRLTLVRGSTHPHPEADIGEHRLRYGLMIHDGVSDLAAVHRAAERFNNPIKVVRGAGGEGFSLARVDADTVTIETAKRAEGSDGLVLRMFEHANRRVRARVAFGMPVKSVARVNLMEEEPEPLEVVDGGVEIAFRPFEIVTLLIE